MKLIISTILCFVGVTAYAEDMEYYSSITVYKCSEVAGDRVLHPADATQLPFEKRVAQEPTCTKEEVFFIQNEKWMPNVIRTYTGIKDGEGVIILIQEKTFTLPSKKIHA